jgi:hypothetical protein
MAGCGCSPGSGRSVNPDSVLPRPPRGASVRNWLIFLANQSEVRPYQTEDEVKYRLQPYEYLFEGDHALYVQTVKFIVFLSTMPLTVKRDLPGVTTMGYPGIALDVGPGGYGPVGVSDF